MKGFWNELQRRQIIKSAVAYLVVSWLVIQVVSILFPIFSFSQGSQKIVVIVLAILFPAWLIFNWIYEPSPKGLVKTDDTPDDSKGIEKKRISLNRVIIVGLSLAVVLLIINTFRLQSKIIRDTDGKSSIAVLYFDNMSADEDNAWISDGMTESISTKLERNKNLLVTGRTSVKQFKDSKESIPEIAKKLGVSYILEGSVRVHNNKALITAQLIDKNDAHVWAKEFNVELNDILETQSTIAGRIVDELKITLTPEEKKQLDYKITENPEAYKLFQKGRALADDRSKKGLEKSIEFYQKAIELDPKFSEAYGEIANSYYLMGHYGYISMQERISKANLYVEKAFKINPNTVTALTVKATLLDDEGDWNRAKEYYEKAIALNPNNAMSHHFFGARNLMKGDITISLKHATIAQKLEPLSGITNIQLIWALLANKKIDEAEEHYKENKHFLNNPQNVLNIILTNKAEIQSLEKKDWTEAIRIYEAVIKERQYDSEPYRLLAEAYDGILNDNNNYLKYAKKAYAIDSTRIRNISTYIGALSEGGKYIEAEQFMKSENYHRVLPKFSIALNSWYYHYCKGDYLKSQEILKDTIFDKAYQYKILNYAQLGRDKETYEILSNNNINTTSKAFAYAILKERDSMYHYLNKDDIDYKIVNSRFEFDPYRKEERYKAFLKKNNLPITHWNE